MDELNETPNAMPCHISVENQLPEDLHRMGRLSMIIRSGINTAYAGRHCWPFSRAVKSELSCSTTSTFRKQALRPDGLIQELRVFVDPLQVSGSTSREKWVGPLKLVEVDQCLSWGQVALQSKPRPSRSRISKRSCCIGQGPLLISLRQPGLFDARGLR